MNWHDGNSQTGLILRGCQRRLAWLASFTNHGRMSQLMRLDYVLLLAMLPFCAAAVIASLLPACLPPSWVMGLRRLACRVMRCRWCQQPTDRPLVPCLAQLAALMC